MNSIARLTTRRRVSARRGMLVACSVPSPAMASTTVCVKVADSSADSSTLSASESSCRSASAQTASSIWRIAAATSGVSARLRSRSARRSHSTLAGANVASTTSRWTDRPIRSSWPAETTSYSSWLASTISDSRSSGRPANTDPGVTASGTAITTWPGGGVICSRRCRLVDSRSSTPSAMTNCHAEPRKRPPLSCS